MKRNILIIGAAGQIGTELTQALRAQYGNGHVVASDIRVLSEEEMESGPFEQLNAMDGYAIRQCIKKYSINEVYLLSAMLSATGEKAPQAAWDLNMQSLLHVLEIAKQEQINKVFWPSSIAVFGSTAKKVYCPQNEYQLPETVYGISKSAGEQWCNYYFKKYGLDVRSVRYPGLISYKALPGGGTTDYSIEMYHNAVKGEHYTCYLDKNSCLPMMYMDDAIRGTMELMEADERCVKIRTSYNIASMSFRPYELAASIKEHITGFSVSYTPDSRQLIADSWPKSIDDTAAREDWGWKEQFDLKQMTKEMLLHISEKTINSYY